MRPPDKSLPLPLIGILFCVGIVLGFGGGYAWKGASSVNLISSSARKGSTANGSNGEGSHDISLSGEPEGTGAGARSRPGDTRDFAVRLRDVMNQHNRGKQWAELSALITSLDPSHIPEALAAIQSLHWNEKRFALAQLLNHWAEKDPRAALAYAQGLTNAAERNQSIASVLSGWGENNSAAAIAWAQQLPAGAMKRQALQGLVMQLAQTDPKAALQLASSQTGSNQSQLVSMALSNWANTDLKGALNYLGQIPEGMQKNRVLQSMIFSVANQDPTSAVSLIDQLPPGQAQDQALQQVASLWQTVISRLPWPGPISRPMTISRQPLFRELRTAWPRAILKEH